MAESDVRCFEKGAPIVVAGAPGECMFVVLSGTAGIDAEHAGHQVEFGPGIFFVELAILDRQPRSVTVRALEDGTCVLPIDRARFMYLVSQQPAFALAVPAALSRHLRGRSNTPKAPHARPPAGTYAAAEIRPGLWQLRSSGRSSNAYLIKGKTRTVLVDTGLPSSAVSLKAAIAATGCQDAAPDLVVLTHEHADHIGGAGLLSPSQPVAAHPLAANKMALGDEFSTLDRLMGEPAEPPVVDLPLVEGSVIEADPWRFEVLHTPGHTSGCISLFDPGRRPGVATLLCGDTVMAGGAMGGVFGSGSLADMIYSLGRLRSLDPSLLLSGHGRVSYDGKADLARALARCHALLADTRALFRTLAETDGLEELLQSTRMLNRLQ